MHVALMRPHARESLHAKSIKIKGRFATINDESIAQSEVKVLLDRSSIRDANRVT